MKKGILLFGLLLGFATFTMAEQPKDFILTMNKDTLYGKIKPFLRSSYIVFEYQKKKLYFRAPTLHFFGIYKDGTYHYYKSIKNKDGKSIFAEILEEGKLKLYSHRVNEPHLPIPHQKPHYYIGNSDDKLVAITSNSYTHQLTYFVKDNPQLLTELREGNFKDVPKIVGVYNKF